MAFGESFHNQSSVLRINIMVLDDDPVFLEVISRMLEKSKYRDPSIMDIRVIAEGDPLKAMSTLKLQRNNIDLIIIDYYMSCMNGLQLISKITKEFGNLPVIVMSSDTNKEQESLTCGAMCFLAKPIKPIDLPKIYQIALTSKRNGKSWSEPNHKMLHGQDNALKTRNKCSSNTNASCLSTNGSRQNLKRRPNGCLVEDGESSSRPSKKAKIIWTDSLQNLFLQAIRHIGLDKAVPKKILAFMNVPYLTRENVASHLQKYRIYLKRVAENGMVSIMSGRSSIESMFRYAHIKEPCFNNYTHVPSWYDTSLNNRSFYSKTEHGFAQSRLLSDTSAPVHFNQMPYNYMNRPSTYEPQHIGAGSNSTLPIQRNLSVPNQPSQNEERRSFFEQHEMANIINQTSQVHGLGNNVNNSMMSTFGSFTPNQPGLSHFSYENTAHNPQLGMTNELPYNISNFEFDHNKVYIYISTT
ncbi:putative two-component response regulator ARR21 [Capsella rubella]|uniref:putative two-component response regulator ARR21 n=1 Tax=Capsella rubella TaxID=81985 RepID=UPI000CD5007C|nr:putative two-component response regulator ARR21 [Capsella rubella]